MEITVKKYRMTYDGRGYVLEKRSSSKAGEETWVDPGYYGTMENACLALLRRLTSDGLREDRPEIVDMKSLIEAIGQAKADVVRAVEEFHPRVA